MPNSAGLSATSPAMRILENEHRYLSFLMQEWHTIVLSFEQDDLPGEEEARHRIRELRRLIMEFQIPLAKHTQKEEEHFFPLLGSYIGFEQGPLVGIQEEHVEIDGYLGHFLHHTAGDLELVPLAKMISAVKDAGEAFEILTVHLVKEEAVIFPMAETQLSEPDHKRLFSRMNTLIT
ncbi:cation-binding protein [Paenibacillus helianthi]|uniref:Cation-binding protein n=1 Tax=Paenibacillus helianthi TaxID=1349432 RepID=A0ABX3EEG8_9BACL|nr:MULTISPECIES: hemerythrin domain-containing protein [Paenibacillus]OKP77608.1 cation-binding protein [Paenibacillus helianthi]OKP78500.1 cation-binding protein [Paenibacillus sp. P3E]